MIKKLVAGFSAWALASSGLLIGKSSSLNDIVFGNYSDYISPDVAQELRKEFNLRIDLFDYDHLVKERFDKGIYDMAIVSTSVLSELKSTGAAMKLKWSELLKDNAQSASIQEDNDESKSLEKAKELFTPIVKDMSQNLLEYGIPYFVQKLGFYYRGEKINALREDKPVSFQELVKIISEDDRFVSKDGKSTLGLIDDPRTVLSFARKVKGEEDVNPNTNEYQTSDDILNDYKKLIDTGLNKQRLGENFFYMTPDSGPLVDALVNEDIQGAFMYNGDGLFAAEGGNAEEEIEDDKFHYVKLSENIFFLDFLTFSQKMPEHKRNNAYQIAKKLLFLTEGNKDKPFKTKKSKPEDGHGGQSCGEEEPEYEEMVVRNFNDVMYTPVLESIYSNLEKCYFSENEDEGKDCDDEKEEESQACGEEAENSKKLVSGKNKFEIIKVEKSDNHPIQKEFERQLDQNQKSNMLIAYRKFKLLV